MPSSPQDPEAMDVGKAPCPPECTMEEISDFIKAEQEYETDSDKDSTPCLSFISPEFAMEEIPDFIKTEQEFESDSDKDRTPPLSSSFPAFAMEEIPDFIKTEQEFESDSDPKGEDESDGEGEDEPDSDYEYLFYSKNYRCVDFSFTDQKWTNRTRSRLTLILERKSESGGDNSDRELEAVHEVEVEPHPESDSPYLFRNYRCPETRANWVVDAILPENDSEEDEDGSDYMPLETDGEESSDEEDENSEYENANKPLTPTEMNDMGLRALKALPGRQFMSLPTIRTIMDRIPEIDLYQVGLRALASIKHHSDPKQSRKIAMLIVVSSLWAVHSSNPDLDAKAPDGTTLNAFRHKGLSDDEVWIAMGEALAVILSQGVGHLKETVALIMEHVKPGLGVDLLAPMFLRLDDTEKEALMDEATQAISNLVDRNSLPDLDLVGSDAM